CCAASRAIWVASFSMVSTTSRKRNSRISPLRRSISARMSYSWPYFERPAFWTACSIASSTSSRSMPLSRATVSATCNSSGRAKVVVLSMVFPVSMDRRRFRLRRREKVVGQDELCPADRGKRQANLASLAKQPDMLFDASEQPPAEALAAVERLDQVDPGLESGEAVIVFRA